MRKLVFVPILFFISFLIVLYVVIPNYTESSALQSQIEAKQKELKEKQDYFANLRLISDNLVQYQEFLDKIEKALPQKVSLASLLSFFQGRVLGSGLIMENLSPSQDNQRAASKGVDEEVEKIKETSFRLTVSGSFVSFENFLRAIEKSSRLVEVASVAFDEGKQKEVEGEVEAEEEVVEEAADFEFNVMLKVYSYSERE